MVSRFAVRKRLMDACDGQEALPLTFREHRVQPLILTRSRLEFQQAAHQREVIFDAVVNLLEQQLLFLKGSLQGGACHNLLCAIANYCPSIASGLSRLSLTTV